MPHEEAHGILRATHLAHVGHGMLEAVTKGLPAQLGKGPVYELKEPITAIRGSKDLEVRQGCGVDVHGAILTRRGS
jgi:hypothetical protein